MAERINIARVAEIISGDIFGKLGWELHGTPNESWTCTDPGHQKADHPTDATFVYRDPYTAKNVHLVTDLKSYGAKTLAAFSLRDTVESLALAVDCAKHNRHWQDLYLKAGAPPDVQGLLFIYNHDGEYDKSFADKLGAAFEEPIRIPRGVRLSVIGPDEVWYLNEMLYDIASLAQNGQIPPTLKELNFFYHSHSRRHLAQRDHSAVATIDMIKGKYQLLMYTLAQQQGATRGMLVYYRGPGKDEREFIVLIDMLRNIGVLDSCDVIHVRCARACTQAANFFHKALSQYAEFPDQQMPDKLKKLKYGSVAMMRPQITNYEVALRS